tara:strand:+ start:1784 stop:2722 length:939 start_codon:yes stop_codon:yes gene_type:complete
MKDFYQVLGVSSNSSDSEIKKAYRKLAIEHHPDKNKEGSDSKFKEIAEAYETLGNTTKKEKYDYLRKNPFSSNYNDGFKSNNRRNQRDHFSEWVNNHSGFKTTSSKVNTSYLNISESKTVSLVDAIDGNPINISYNRKIVTSDLKSESENKNINVYLKLADKYANLIEEKGKFYVKIKLESLGNESVYNRVNIWGDPEIEVLKGDYILKIKIDLPLNIKLEGNNIIQYLDVPLKSVILKDENIEVTTILGKKYKAEINSPEKLNDLKFNIKGSGLKSIDGKLGNYIIRFNVMCPDLSNTSDSDLNKLKSIIS